MDLYQEKKELDLIHFQVIQNLIYFQVMNYQTLKFFLQSKKMQYKGISFFRASAQGDQIQSWACPWSS